MKSHQLLKELIDLVAQFEQQVEYKSIDLEHFMAWVLANTTSSEAIAAPKDVNGKIFELLGSLDRYSSFYSKELFKTSELSTLWDFIFLAILEEQDHSMTALIKRVKLDKSAGMEVIRRLMKQQFVIQVPNPNDGRSKLLKLAKAGKKILQSMYPKVVELAETISGDLSIREKLVLLGILKKLDQHHSKNSNLG